MTRPVRTRVVWVLSAVCLVFLAGGLWLYAASGTGLETGRTAFALGMMAGLLPVGALVALRQSRNPIGWIFLGLAVSVALGALAGGYAEYWTTGTGGSPWLGKTATWYADSS